MFQDGRTQNIAAGLQKLPGHAGCGNWLTQQLPCPLVAGIAHIICNYPSLLATALRAARLLTTSFTFRRIWLEGLYSLEEYYARNLGDIEY